MAYPGKKQLVAGIFCLTAALPGLAMAQNIPIVVLEYPGLSSGPVSDSDNEFIRNPDYTTRHKVAPNETLSHVMQRHYGGSGLNMQFVQMAIVAANKHAFVRNNPNSLYAGKTLLLPSVNQMQAMVLGRAAGNSDNQNAADNRRDQIYFIGG